MSMQGVGIAMQRMHQSYKCMKAQQKKLSGCASNLLAHEDLGHWRKSIVGIYKPSSIMKNSHQYMKVTKQETLYHKDHGATLKHKCEKKDSSIAPFFWAFFFYLAFPLFFLAFFYLAFLFFWDNALLMMIITLLFIYNSMITTRYQNKDDSI